MAGQTARRPQDIGAVARQVDLLELALEIIASVQSRFGLTPLARVLMDAPSRVLETLLSFSSISH